VVDESQPFEWPIRVYYEDTDAQGVVYYANYFRYMERARTEWLRAAGVNQAEMLNEQRRMFVVTATNAEFLAPARFNDEVMVTARLAGLTRATFDIEQNIFLQGPKGRLLVRGNITAAFLNADNMRPMRVPADIFEDKN
jgi:acyl-CoA thioester hydrolase